MEENEHYIEREKTVYSICCNSVITESVPIKVNNSLLEEVIIEEEPQLSKLGKLWRKFLINIWCPIKYTIAFPLDKFKMWIRYKIIKSTIFSSRDITIIGIPIYQKYRFFPNFCKENWREEYYDIIYIFGIKVKETTIHK